MKCKVCESNELVWSGTDAFMLGVPTETFCYRCAKTYAIVKQTLEEKEEN